VTRNVLKLWAFLKRDFLAEVSYRLAFLMQVGGMVLSLAGFYFMTRMWNQNAEGLNGIPPFDWLLVGLSFQFYFSTALFAFSAKVRSEQVIGTLEAMLVSPTPTSIVIFSSAAWDFTYGAIRVLIYLAAGTLLFGVTLHVGSVSALVVGFVLTLLSSAGIGILSASFILYFKRGNPINFLLSGTTMMFGTVFFPAEQLPEWLRPVSSYLPITWSLRIVRGVLLEARTLDDLSGELVRLALLTVVILPCGLVASRYAIRRAKREGSLIQY
jgi:ABC-2 type transport system permease protein